MRSLTLLITILAALAVIAAGYPRRSQRFSNDAGLRGFFLEVDRGLILACTAVVFGTTIAVAADAISAPGCILLLALVVGLAVLIAIDRHRRTNGEQSPYRTLLARTHAASAKAPYDEDALDRAVERADSLPPGLVRALAGAMAEKEDPAVPLCETAASYALRTRADGTIVWRDTLEDDDLPLWACAVLLAGTHPEVLELVVSDARVRIDARDVLDRVAPFAGDQVDAPDGGCTAQHPADSTRFVPLLPVAGAPVAEWVIGTAAATSGVTLRQLEAAARVA